MRPDLANTLRAVGWLALLLLLGAIAYLGAYWPIFDAIW